jgi:hypothetical protein
MILSLNFSEYVIVMGSDYLVKNLQTLDVYLLSSLVPIFSNFSHGMFVKVVCLTPLKLRIFRSNLLFFSPSPFIIITSKQESASIWKYTEEFIRFLVSCWIFARVLDIPVFEQF